MKRKMIGLFVGIMMLVVVFSAVGIVMNHVSAGSEEAEWQQASTVMEIIAIARTRYYQPVHVFDLIRSYVKHGTINGMLAEALDDPYSRFMDPYSFEMMMTRTEGKFGGIGIMVGMRDDQITIIAPIKGTPGEAAGLRGGDKIVGIDGKPTTYMSMDEAVSLMRGDPDTDVTLTIRRDEDEFDVPIVRDIINVESVTEAKLLDHQIGYIEMSNFSDRTASEIREALDSLEEQGMKALILDLRFNPGGTLSAALEVANEFISEGPLLFVEDRDGRRESYDASEDGTRTPLPMVVLINGGSASASEIVAGALRDTKLATLVGTKTFGKGLIQSVHPLRDGSALTLTEQVYLTAGGHNIDKEGIIPDVIVEIDEDEEVDLYLNETDVPDVQLDTAVELLLGQLSSE